MLKRLTCSLLWFKVMFADLYKTSPSSSLLNRLSLRIWRSSATRITIASHDVIVVAVYSKLTAAEIDTGIHWYSCVAFACGLCSFAGNGLTISLFFLLTFFATEIHPDGVMNQVLKPMNQVLKLIKNHLAWCLIVCIDTWKRLLVWHSMSIKLTLKAQTLIWIKRDVTLKRTLWPLIKKNTQSQRYSWEISLKGTETGTGLTEFNEGTLWIWWHTHRYFHTHT